ncbi:MAG: hypothetical protein KBS76_03760 [Ruminococcus sp.]|nr:hypothetical protein [Candidatus Apopatosoma intestinale]
MIALGGKNGRAFAFDGKAAKKIEISKNGVWRTAWEAGPVYDYGDGHLNTVVDGYNGLIYSYSASTGTGQAWDLFSTSYSSGNIRYHVWWTPPLFQSTQSIPASESYSGTNTRAFTVDATNTDMTVGIHIHYGSYTSGISLSDLKITVNGTAYTLQQAVTAGVIRPLVVLYSADSGPYYFPSVLNLYSGGQTGTGSFPALRVYFMLAKGNVMTAFSFWASKAASGSPDGSEAAACPADTCRFVLSLPS